MADVQANSIFGNSLPDALIGSGICITPRDTPPMAAVSAWPGAIEAVRAFFSAIKCDLADEPGRSVRCEAGLLSHCQSPGRWLVEHPGLALPDMSADIGVIVDLGHARSSFIFAGSDAVEFAQKLAPVDFSLPRNGPMSFVQSGSDHGTGLALWRESADRFIVYVERSFGLDFWRVLAAESMEFRV